jgi:hypothetical protein
MTAPSSARLPVGTLVSDRFRIEAEAGAGGMGVVYRARDRESGELVALKVLAQEAVVDASRFERERTLLAELDHPGIVRYVDRSRGGRLGEPPWLAMEWLEGETLAARIRRGPLPIALAVRIVRDAARALGSAHAAGIVHRDLKPANLFLVGDEPRVKVLDFGIARRARPDATTLTTTGTVLGTPYYMAPEQARGGPEIDPRIDVYALGCVLYESLTGARPFEHESVVAVLAAVLLEQAPSPRERAPSIPEALDAMILTMLDKRATARPADGAAVAAALDQLLEDEAAMRASTSPAPLALTKREQRVVCVVLVEGVTPSGGAARTLAAGQGEDLEGRVRAVVEPLSGEVIALLDGSLVVTVDASGAATDHAARAARVALAIRTVAGEAAIAVAAGRAEITGRVPVGEVVQRGADLLRGAAGAAIRVDSVVARLLDGRFRVRTENGESYLDAQRDPDTARDDRTIVGRDRELAQLEALFGDACDEPIPRAAIVTGAPGSGKSRLATALLARIAPRCARAITVQVDPLLVSAPLALAAELVREAAGIASDDELSRRRERLRALGAASDRWPVMLGELCRAPFDVEADPALAGARRDPRLRGDLEVEAVIDWLAHECSLGAVTIVIDDAQHADRASLELIDGALRRMTGRPLFVVALGRPELETVHPGLFADRDPEVVKLGRLLPRAARTLVERELQRSTAKLDADLAARIVERADGNPLFLEELARAAREGSDTSPTGVLAMVEARIATLDVETRRVARAASVFGMRAPVSGVRALIGERPIDDALHVLGEREILIADARTEGHVAFTQPLLREAAYAMLTDDDRTLGHRLAGEWLAANAEVEPAVLALHFERGGLRDVAARAWAGAAEIALGANDLGAAIAHAERGLELAQDAVAQVSLWASAADAHRWRGDYARAFELAERARLGSSVGSAAYFAATTTLVASAMRLGHDATLDAIATQVEALDVSPSQRPSQIALLCRIASRDLAARALDRAEHRLARAESLESSLATPDPIASAWVRTLRASQAYDAGAIDAFVDGTTEAARLYTLGGDARDACNQRVRLGHAWNVLGVPSRAEIELVRAQADAARMGLRLVEGYALTNLGHAQSLAGRPTDAAATLARAITIATTLSDVSLEAGARIYLAEDAIERGDLDAAIREAERARDASVGPFAVLSSAVLARAIAMRSSASALSIAREARAAIATSDVEADARAALALVEALGDAREAATVAREAAARIGERALRITDPERRASYLASPIHARLLRRAHIGQ